MTPAGLPHSEISGSKPVSSSPKLIAAFRVLHRLLVPRHPPSALSSLTISLFTTKLALNATQAFRANLVVKRLMVKLLRADGGCLGTRRR